MNLKSFKLVHYFHLFISFLTLFSGIVMIVFLELKHQSNTYRLIGYSFIGVSLFFIFLNLILVGLLIKKIHYYELQYELKFTGLIYLIFGTWIFYLDFISLKKWHQFLKEVLASEKFNDFLSLDNPSSPTSK